MRYLMGYRERRMDEQTVGDAGSVDERAAIARGLLREAANAGLPALRTLNRGRVMEVSLTPAVLGGLPIGRSGYRIVAGRTVWRLGVPRHHVGCSRLMGGRPPSAL